MTGTIRGVAAGAAIAVLAACGAATQQGAEGARPRGYTVPVYNANSQQVASFTVTQVSADSIRLVVESTGLPAGTHGTHLHAVGRCDAPQFTTAGAHLNPTSRQHGLRNPQGPHLGDMPNLTVGANGQGRMETIVRGSLTPGRAPLFDADGTSLVVHASADDQVTDPAGNSGARIACGLLASPTAG
ncbi:MAG TPA: superoxide dismutase family protein [Longimicrobium sp.]|nr:superoxide dismutase family protein [Longimicrobium sp.]